KTPQHSITRRPNSLFRIDRSSAFAVFRLMTNSYFVGACTGRSVVFTFENGIDVACRSAIYITQVYPVGDQCAVYGRKSPTAAAARSSCSHRDFLGWQRITSRGGPPGSSVPLQTRAYCPAWFLIASSIWALTASRLKEAGACIGGNSMAVFANSATLSCTGTKRQNSRA